MDKLPTRIISGYLLLTLLALGTITGCMMPRAMKVDTASHPRYVDKDVRFRTTYYFRVYDYCQDDAKAGTNNRVHANALYRFRMTGKASSLTNAVHFESGTLFKEQIDPAGR